MSKEFNDMYGFLTAEAMFKSPEISELVLVTNNPAGNCNPAESRGFYRVSAFGTHILDDLSIIVHANSTKFAEFAESVDITYGIIQTAVVPAYKRSVLANHLHRRSDDGLSTNSTTSLISSSSNIDQDAVVSSLGGPAAFGGNTSDAQALNLLTIPPALCDENCQGDIVSGLNSAGLFTAEDWGQVISDGLENAAQNPPAVGQDSDIDFVFRDPSATYTDLHPSQVIAVAAADPQITKRAVLPGQVGFHDMRSKRLIKRYPVGHLVRRGLFDGFTNFAKSIGGDITNAFDSASASAASLASRLASEASAEAESILHDIEREYTSVSNAGVSVISQITVAEQNTINAIEAYYSKVSTAASNEANVIRTSASAIVSSVASVAARESSSVVSLAEAAYSSISAKASSIASAASVLGNEAISEAALEATRASASALSFLSAAEAKATSIAQVITVVAQGTISDVQADASAFGQDLESAADAVANSAEDAAQTVGQGIINLASQAESTYDEVTSAVEKALGEHDVSPS